MGYLALEVRIVGSLKYFMCVDLITKPTLSGKIVQTARKEASAQLSECCNRTQNPNSN
jgi:hypothetical protein